MRLLDRYIGSSIVSSLLVVTSVLVALFTFMSFFEQLDDIGRGQYDTGQALLFTLLNIPALVYQLMPMATLLGCIIGLGLLANNSELIVIRSAGVSLGRIAWSVIKIGILVIAVLIFIGEWLAPKGLQMAQQLRANALSDNVNIGSQAGLWAKDGLTMINAKELLPGDRLGDVRIYKLDEQYRLVELMRAEYAAYRNGQWTLNNVESSTLHSDISADTPANEKVTVEHYATLNWNTSVSPDLINVVAVKPETLSVWGLYEYTQYLRKNGLNVGRFEQTLWSKFTTPVIALLMVLLSIPLVFGSFRSVSISQRIFVGVLIGVGFNLLNRLVNYAGLVYDLNVAVYMFFPIVVAAMFTYFMYRRVY
jgi:lipopolysaccharide export system permease protein